VVAFNSRDVRRLVRPDLSPQSRFAFPLLIGLSLATATALSLWKWRQARCERQRLLLTGAVRSLNSSWYRVAGIRMHARISTGNVNADRDPVILIHGLGVSSSYFVPTAERLAAHFAVLAPDLPGHGRSDALSPVPDVKALAEIGLEWMSTAGISRASIIGHSMGCEVAIEMALRNPDRIRRLVLIGPTPDPDARNLAVQLGRLLLGVLYERTSLALHVLRDYLRMGTRLVPEFYAMLLYPIEERLPLVTVPTLLMRGEKDPVVPQRWLEEAAVLVGTERGIAIPRWGHAVQYSAARQVVATVEPFLSAGITSQLNRG
jgi:2-hydroxy-6-oxonona-2,4-dienedioate hydrolase